jgi:hypothetical protein
MDPLSEVLAAMDLRAAAPSRLEAGGAWSFSFPGHEHLKVGARRRDDAVPAHI